MDCKLFVSDIDGTLLDRNKRVHPSDMDAIRELHENGVSFCLASGRMYAEIKSVMDGMGVPYSAICQNGASVYDWHGQLLANHSFEANLALSIIRFLEGTGLVTVVCAADGNYVAVKDRLAEDVGERFLSELMEDYELPKKVKCGKFPVTKLSVYGDVARLKKLLLELDAIYGERIAAFFSDPDGVDIMPQGVDKGVGVRRLMIKHGASPDEIACIGDSFNDIAMFRVTPNSFAMSSSHEHVKREARFTAVSVAHAVKQLINR